MIRFLSEIHSNHWVGRRIPIQGGIQRGMKIKEEVKQR